MSENTLYFFFFQAEDGIRDVAVTGVQTCALPISPALVALGLSGLVAAAPLGAQACREPHYRWTQKTDTTLADVAPQPTSVAVILATWAPPHLGPRDRCAPRSDHELETYSVTAWVRRGDRFKDEGGWASEVDREA